MSKRKATAASNARPLTPDEVKKLLQEYGKLDNKLSILKSQKANKISDVNAKYDDEITNLGNRHSDIKNQIEEWAENNREAQFGDKKSKDMIYGKIGFRSGTEKLELENEEEKGWDDIVKTLKADKECEEFVKISESLDKKAILKAMNASDDDAEFFKNVGLRKVKSENFFIKLP